MKSLILFFIASIFYGRVNAQICGTPGFDGPVNISTSINTYFPPAGNITLTAGAKSLNLAAVPPNDFYGNNFGLEPIKAGDLILIIQMQDADINFTNNNLYGGNTNTSGPDGLGGTGFTSLGNSGHFEYVIATTAVPLTGGNLTFKGAGAGNGTVFTYINAAASSTSGKKTFEVVRVPQFSNLVLSTNISTPPFNGIAGGIIAFDVAGSMDFNGYTINASAKGFRGGYGKIGASGANINYAYAIPSTDTRSVGKGEGIAGTPRYMWDGFNQVDNTDEGLPGGSYGKGAPANAGGGGNDHNAGGGGGGNGGSGGVGGDGTRAVGSPPDGFPNGGRPGSSTLLGVPDLARIIMGGGGGGGDANDALSGVKGGVGGGIILINAGAIVGSGIILANGGDGAPGVSGANPDGAGGGGAGGTIFIKVSNPNPLSILKLEAKGGKGGDTHNDVRVNTEHGPGGGGGGGLIFYTTTPGTVTTDISGGMSGKTNSGNGITHNAEDGKIGRVKFFVLSDLPAYLQGGGASCYPQLTTTIEVPDPTVNKYAGAIFNYTITCTNNAAGGNAGGVQLQVEIAAGLNIISQSVTYTGNSGGPSTVSNTGTATNAIFGDFNIAPGNAVIITLTLQVDCNAKPGLYNASAQAQYLDPSRTIRDPFRRITPALNAFASANTIYETGITGPVPGTNFNGKSLNAVSDDVTIIVLTPLLNNVIDAGQQLRAFCLSGDPAMLTGANPTGGSNVYEYQWQSSVDNINFTNIASATLKNFDPPALVTSTYYRRIVSTSPCITPDSSNIIAYIVNQKPVVDFVLPQICLKDGKALFENTSYINDSSSTTLQYQWNFGDTGSLQNTSTIKSPVHNYTKVGRYPVVLTVRSGVCTTTLSKNFIVNGSIPKADFILPNETLLCSNQPVEFVDKATVDFGEITTIQWFFNQADPAGSIIDSMPANRAATSKMYTYKYPLFNSPADTNITVRMLVHSGISCSSEKTMVIQLKAMPKITFTALTPVCSNTAPFVLSQGSEVFQVLKGISSYSGKGVAQNMFNPQLVQAGNNNITYTFLASNGCVDSLSQNILVNPTPVVTGGSVEILQGGQIILPAAATGNGLTFNWFPVTGLSATNVLQPIASPLADIAYTLTATTAAGCIAIANTTVKVLKTPSVPNAFSPNGDGINDTWTIPGLTTYTNATLEVFNRYGQKLFVSRGYNAPWNGTHNGKPLPVGTYYYIINTNKGHQPITGSVTIFR